MPIGRSVIGAVSVYLHQLRPELDRGKSEGRLLLNARGQPLSRVGAWGIVKRAAARAGHHEARHAPHAPPQLRDPPARGRRRPPRRAGDAGPRRPLHHPDLHPRRPRVPALGAQAVSSAGMRQCRERGSAVRLAAAGPWPRSSSSRGCVRYVPQPIEPAAHASAYRARRLDDTALVAWVGTMGRRPEPDRAGPIASSRWRRLATPRRARPGARRMARGRRRRANGARVPGPSPGSQAGRRARRLGKRWPVALGRVARGAPDASSSAASAARACNSARAAHGGRGSGSARGRPGGRRARDRAPRRWRCARGRWPERADVGARGGGRWQAWQSLERARFEEAAADRGRARAHRVRGTGRAAPRERGGGGGDRGARGARRRARDCRARRSIPSR